MGVNLKRNLIQNLGKKGTGVAIPSHRSLLMFHQFLISNQEFKSRGQLSIWIPSENYFNQISILSSTFFKTTRKWNKKNSTGELWMWSYLLILWLLKTMFYLRILKVWKSSLEKYLLLKVHNRLSL